MDSRQPATHEWARSLDTLLDQAWKRLGRGVADRRAAARHPTLATVDADGCPQARTVVLRTADRDTGELRVYTDRHADKVAEVQSTPRAAVHVWDQSAHLQLRLVATVNVLTGSAVESIWNGLSEHARRCYGFGPVSGTSIDEATAYGVTPTPEAFAVLALRVETVDVLHLGHRHRRALYTRESEWAGNWIVP
jgi:hypothetical protein